MSIGTVDLNAAVRSRQVVHREAFAFNGTVLIQGLVQGPFFGVAISADSDCDKVLITIGNQEFELGVGSALVTNGPVDNGQKLAMSSIEGDILVNFFPYGNIGDYTTGVSDDPVSALDFFLLPGITPAVKRVAFDQTFSQAVAGVATDLYIAPAYGRRVVHASVASTNLIGETVNLYGRWYSGIVAKEVLIQTAAIPAGGVLDLNPIVEKPYHGIRCEIGGGTGTALGWLRMED